jgi:hypothetical protein
MGICIAYSGKLRESGLVPELVGDLKARAEGVGWPCHTMNELVAKGIVTCAGLEGISLYPHRECEPIHFHFDKEGTFVNHFYYTLLVDPERAAFVREGMAASAAFMEGLTAKSSGGKSSTGKSSTKTRRGEANAGGSGVRVSLGVPGMPEAPDNTFFQGGLRYNWTKTQFAGAKVHVAVCTILRYVKERYAPELEITDDSGYFVHGDYEKLETELAHVDYINSITSQAVETVAASGGRMTLDAFIARLNKELAGAKNKLH